MVAPARFPTDAELARLNLFRSMDIETIRSHLRRCSVSSLQPGDVLIAADRPNDRVYLLLSGALGVHLGSPADPPIVVLRAGETVGELSLIDKQPTSAFVVAQTACRVLVMDESVMWDLVQSSHTIALNLLNTLSHRLRYDNRLIYQDREQLRERVQELEAEREALQHSEQRYQTLYDLNPTMFITVDGQGVVLSANQLGAAELGYAVSELVGQPISRLYLPDDRAYASSQLDRCLAEPGNIHRWEARKVRKDGTELWARETARAIGGRQHQPSVLVVSEDITESRRRSEQLVYDANHDALTGLVNRRAFEERLRHALLVARAERVDYALCYLDLDQFKAINDSCGHVAGDEFLRQIGRVLQGVVSKRDTLARLGGDEFGVLLERCKVEQARRVADAVLEAVDNLCLSWEDRRFRVGISIGLVPIDHTSESVEAVLGAADAACYAAKEAGRNRIHVYDRSDPAPAAATRHMDWIEKINHGLEDGGFHLSYQPIVALGKQRAGRDSLRGAAAHARRRRRRNSAGRLPADRRALRPVQQDRCVGGVEPAVSVRARPVSDRPRRLVCHQHFAAFHQRSRFHRFPARSAKEQRLAAGAHLFRAHRSLGIVERHGCAPVHRSVAGCGLPVRSRRFRGRLVVARAPEASVVRLSQGGQRVRQRGGRQRARLRDRQGHQRHLAGHARQDGGRGGRERRNPAALRDPRLRIDYVQGYAIQRPRPLAELFSTAAAE